jgi:hypothetical protein
VEGEHPFKRLVNALDLAASEGTPDWQKAALALQWAVCQIVARHSKDERDFLVRMQNGGETIILALAQSGLLPIGASLEKEAN